MLVLIVKHWAINAQINESMHGTLNSYSLLLLVIHYLQTAVLPPVLPSLQALYPHVFTMRRPAHTLTFGEPAMVAPVPPELRPCNTASVGELLVGFFAYYARTFDWRAHAISIRHACVINRKCMDEQSNKYDIFVEEPYDLANTARCVRQGVCARVSANNY
jgi:poly(A) RNA polymerase GLD2